MYVSYSHLYFIMMQYNDVIKLYELPYHKLDFIPANDSVCIIHLYIYNFKTQREWSWDLDFIAFFILCPLQWRL
jgi:hypothetical protein